MEITSVRGAVVEGNFDWPIVRIETDTGISGYGEVRDFLRPNSWHSETFYVDDPLDLALNLEPELVGRDPTDVLGIFESIEQYGGWGRLGGGVSGVEMALWDITGKHLGVPVYELLGGAYRDEIRIYCDCRAGNPVSDSSRDYDLDGNDYSPEAYAEHATQREAEGFDFLKFDLDPRALEYVDGTAGVRGSHLTEAGLEYLEDVVAALRGEVGTGTDIGFDCASMRELSVADTIRFGRVLDEYGIAALEDARHDRDVSDWNELTEAIDTPTITGEDLYTTDGFRELVRREAIDLVGPDLLTAGGIRETVRIASFAGHHGMAANLHFAGSPVGFMASVHAAAAIDDLLALEFHAIGVPWWGDLVEQGPLFDDGYAPVPDRPGLGIDLDEGVLREHTRSGDPPLV